MQALLTSPGVTDSTRVGPMPDPVPAGDQLLLRTSAIGVCGTDREIDLGHFGTAPAGDEDLVLGHEFLGVVVDGGHGFAAGDFVTASVRRPCPSCEACEAGAPDSCLTGDYVERGIRGLHGFGSELVVESAANLVAVPAALGALGVLAEPTSVCVRGLRHAYAIADRQPWRRHRALVLGAGAIGMLTTYLLRLDGFEVWTVARGGPDTPKGLLAAACGARYVSTRDTSLVELRAEVGGFDVVVEATGVAQVMADAMSMPRRSGVVCLLGVDAARGNVELAGRVLGVEFILENRAVFGSVNAAREDWRDAVDRLGDLAARWPDALDGFVGLRAAPDDFRDAFAYGGVKAVLDFEAGS